MYTLKDDKKRQIYCRKKSVTFFCFNIPRWGWAQCGRTWDGIRCVEKSDDVEERAAGALTVSGSWWIIELVDN